MVALTELFGKMLQSHQSIDIDNDLPLHVQHVKLPWCNSNTKRKLTDNMGLNIILKSCVLRPLNNMRRSHVSVKPWL